jgi:hypothetical protein
MSLERRSLLQREKVLFELKLIGSFLPTNWKDTLEGIMVAIFRTQFPFTFCSVFGGRETLEALKGVRDGCWN